MTSPEDLDALDLEYYRGKTYEYKALRAKLETLAKMWRGMGAIPAFKHLPDWYHRGLGVCADELEAVLKGEKDD